MRAKHGARFTFVKRAGVKFDFAAAILARASDVIGRRLGFWLTHIFTFTQ
jgi:hypothetical protein